MSFLGVPVLLTDHGGKTGTATVVEAGKLVTYEVHYRLVLVHGVTAARRRCFALRRRAALLRSTLGCCCRRLLALTRSEPAACQS